MKMSMAKSRQLFSPKRSVIDVKRALNRPLRAKHASSMTSEKLCQKSNLLTYGTFWSVVYPKSNYFLKCLGILARIMCLVT